MSHPFHKWIEHYQKKAMNPVIIAVTLRERGIAKQRHNSIDKSPKACMLVTFLLVSGRFFVRSTCMSSFWSNKSLIMHSALRANMLLLQTNISKYSKCLVCL